MPPQTDPCHCVYLVSCLFRKRVEPTSSVPSVSNSMKKRTGSFVWQIITFKTANLIQSPYFRTVEIGTAQLGSQTRGSGSVAQALWYWLEDHEFNSEHCQTAHFYLVLLVSLWMKAAARSDYVKSMAFMAGIWCVKMWKPQIPDLRAPPLSCRILGGGKKAEWWLWN